MKNITYILILALQFSCAINKQSKLKRQRIVFNDVLLIHDPILHTKPRKQIVHIPISFIKEEITTVDCGGYGREYRFLYKDNSILYFSELGATPNSENLKFKFNNEDSLYNSLHNIMPSIEPLVIEGVDKEGFYWKEIRLCNKKIGYIKVVKENLILFDGSLSKCLYAIAKHEKPFCGSVPKKE